MSRYAYHQLDGNHRQIVDALKRAGCTVEPLGRPVDIAVGRHGRTYLFEIKLPKAKLRATQQRFIERWSGHVEVLRSLDDVQIFLQREL